MMDRRLLGRPIGTRTQLKPLLPGLFSDYRISADRPPKRGAGLMFSEAPERSVLHLGFDGMPVGMRSTERY